MKETIYLIGGSGFIGKHLARVLSKEYNITVFDKFIDGEYFKRFPTVGTYRIDLTEEKIPETYETPDFIINLASIVTAERDFSLFDSLVASNLKILLNLYERFKDCKKLKMFIQFGSSEEYGKALSPYIETIREQPVSPYALVKQLTTNTALMLHSNYGFPAMVVRPGNLFGEGQNPSKFIPYVVQKLKSGESLNVTPCEQKRDFIHIDDFVDAIHVIIRNYSMCLGEIINISSGVSVSLKSIIENYKRELKSTSQVNYGAIPYRENEAMDLRCDTTKLDSLQKLHRLTQKLAQMTK